MAASSFNAYDLSASASAALLVQLVQEIEQTPAQHWDDLLQAIRRFRQGLTLQPSAAEQAWNDALQAASDPNPARQAALSQLLDTWMADEDEDEQASSWEFLSQELDRDRLSDRPFLP
jgi:hypothetical protein